MVKHVIIWTLKTEYSDSEKRAAAEKIKSGLEGLAGRIPGMTSVKVNIDLLPSSTGDVMLDTEFTDESALKAYQTNPEHLLLRHMFALLSATENALITNADKAVDNVLKGFVINEGLRKSS